MWSLPSRVGTISLLAKLTGAGAGVRLWIRIGGLGTEAALKIGWKCKAKWSYRRPRIAEIFMHCADNHIEEPGVLSVSEGNPVEA